jgi:O-antigen ligase
VGLAAVLPFEMKTPLFSLGPFQITTVEAGLYLVIIIWGLSRLLEGTSGIFLSPSRLRHETNHQSGMSPGWTLAHTAVALWAAVVVLSALWTHTDKGAALKFALRNLAGCALFFAASDLASTPASAAPVGVALVAGSCVSAVAGLAEFWLPDAAVFLMKFKTQPSLAGGYLRASGTFQYVNIASMYWEATLPLVLTIPLWWEHRRLNRRWTWAAIGASLVLGAAILLGASRAGIVIATLVPIFLIFLSRYSTKSLRAAAAVALIFLLSVVAIQTATGGLPLLRLTTRDVSSWYRVDYRDFPLELRLETDRLIMVPLTIRNDGRLPWRARGSHLVEVTYHWLDAAGKTVLIWEGVRSEIPSDVEPGAAVKVEAWIVTPPTPGAYALQWDMLEQDMTWFSVLSPTKVNLKVEVVPSKSAPASSSYQIPTGLLIPSQPSRADLWRAAVCLWLESPILGVGPDNFRRLYGPVLGLRNFDNRIHANNLYLEILATTGLSGALAHIAVLISIWVAIGRAWSRVGNAEDRLVVIGIGAALAAFCLHGMVDYFLPFTPTYCIFWTLAGMAAGLGRMQGMK